MQVEKIRRIACSLILGTLLLSPIELPVTAGFEVVAQVKSRKNKVTAKSRNGSKKGGGANKSGTSKSGTKSAGETTRKGATGKNKGKSTSGTKKLSSAELKRQQENAQKEIARTKEELRRNEASIKKNLNSLGKIEVDIATSTKQVNSLRSEVSKLQRQIESLTAKIDEENGRLQRLREEYLKAVKKMRGSRKRNSSIAFLFSSSDLTQAERRMRYLKEFSKWRESKTTEIEGIVASLREENARLERVKSDQAVLLGKEEKARHELEARQKEQNRIVADLRANGTALQSHLSKKQAEVNELRNRVAAVIAEEQRKADEERRRQEAAEAARREEQRRKEETFAKAKEENASIEKERSQQPGNESKNKKQSAKKETVTDPPKDVKTEQKRESRKESKKDVKRDTRNERGKDYASARKRKPRSGAVTSKGTANKKNETTQPTSSSSGNFASMKGQLPRPVSGSFRITSPFGRHALPDLPDVVYDNPGIDAEVATGVSATAVFPGKVSGVYVIPGFSTVVIVNHGDYYTVYGNIESASVKVGDMVKTGTPVGRVASDPDDPGHGMIHFEVWKNREKLNPASWIR